MLGSSIQIGSGANTLISTVTDIPDDIYLGIGNDSDGVILNRSTTLNANTALTGVLIGTPDVDALAANSLIISNITADGDMVFVINDGGTSKSLIWLDGSAGVLNFPLGFTSSGNMSVGGSILFNANAKSIAAPEVTDNYAWFRAHDTGVGLVEIARMQGAADPYFQIGRDDTGVALNAVTDMLVLQAGGGTGNEAANFGLGVAFNVGNAASEVEKRGAINLVIETATNGSEDTEMHFWTMAGGSLNQAFKVGSNGELYADLDGDSGSYLTNGVNLFDEFDDVAELRKFQLTVPNSGLITEEQRMANRERMRELGVVKTKNDGSGDHLKLQSMFRLIAGGIFQNRQLLDNLANRLEAVEAKI